MDIYSLEFWLLVLLAAIILWMRLRKKNFVRPSRGRQLSLKGDQIRTFIHVGCPLGCLIDDGRAFGEDFQDKALPQLPHGEGCQCEVRPLYKRADEIFEGKKKDLPRQETDLGPLDQQKLRYYKYRLILAHSDVQPEQASEYKHALEWIKVDDSFIEQVNQQLKEKQ